MLLTYILGSLALIVKPGPDLMCTLATALSDGKARAAMLMTGLVAGCWLWVLILAAGVASIFTDNPAVMLTIQCVGTCYIAYLAVCAYKEALEDCRLPVTGATGVKLVNGWRLVGRGILMSMSNPLTILFFLAFLPNFTHEDATLSPAIQTLLLGTIFCALVPFVYLPVIFAADFFRTRLLSSAKASARIKFVSATMLALVAIVLAYNIVVRLK